MRCRNTFKYMVILFFSAALLPLSAWAAGDWPDPKTYLPSADEMMKKKATSDDKTDLFVAFHPKDVLPPEMWNRINWDIDEMQELWAELIGFKSPDRVGKIAPEIKPGKYSYKDMEKYPGFKELFPEYIYKTVKAGSPPIVCNVMDFELEPTRQLHLALPAAKITKDRQGKSKLDKDGYLVPGSWGGGYPFPRPSGEFKAQQVYYNFEKTINNYEENYLLTGEGLAFDKNLTVDKYNKYERRMVKLMGRSFMAPFGWYDARAEKRGEFSADTVMIYEPRANRGLVTMLLRYDDINNMDPMMMYLPQMRRIRKMSSSDTQDPNGDSAYDDMGFLRQKITPKRFPYKFEIIGEREYLLPWSYNAGKAWVDSKNGYALRDISFMRRPCYVLQMTQQDPNYIYSKRIYYMDAEMFLPSQAEFYDQKGRLYRTYNIARSFMPETGQVISHGMPSWQVDYIDSHSSIQVLTVVPAHWSRSDFNMQNLIKKGK